MRRYIMALCALTVCLSARALPAQTHRVVLPLGTYFDVLPSLEVKFKGREHTMLLDTGGGLTVITPATAAAIGCHPWGRLTGFRMRGDKVDMLRCDHVNLALDGIVVHLPEVGVWDFGKVLPKNAPPLAGSIALDAFAHHQVTLDLARRRFIIETRRSLAERLRREHAISVPVRFEREVDGASLVPLIGIHTAKGRVWMEIDSGSDGDLIANLPLAQALGLNPEARGLQTMRVLIGHDLSLRVHARLADLVVDGDIGQQVLRRWVITLDLPRRKLWLAPAKPTMAAAATRIRRSR